MSERGNISVINEIKILQKKIYISLKNISKVCDERRV